MNLKPWFLPLALAVTLPLVYVLPESSEMAPSAAIMNLPEEGDGWYFQAKAASEAEIKTLGTETDFSKATCYRPRPGEFGSDGRPVPDMVDVSIVLSGSDLNTSIHRPERCMPAQGHSILDTRRVMISVDESRHFPARRLLSERTVPLENGRKLKLQCVTYYFFVGRAEITDDHIRRTLIDMKDRLIHGTDQRWAYVSVTMMYGDLPWMNGKMIPIEEADRKLVDFLGGFAAKQIDWERIGG